MPEPTFPWHKRVYQLPDDHGWTAAPGHEILVLDTGAVVLQYPDAWFVEPAAGQINIRDGATAARSTCTLAVSYLRLPPVGWSRFPLAPLLEHAFDGDEHELIAAGPVIEMRRDAIGFAWTERRLVDPAEHRESRSRTCIARAHAVQALITLDYWPEDEARVTAIWDHALDSLRLGVEVDDPTRGKRIG